MRIKLNNSSFILEKDNTEIDVFEKLNGGISDNVAILGENIPDNYVVGEDNNAYRVLPDNNIVPVSHPDLSTQPSILPYRFGATPVYEVLSRVEDLISQDYKTINIIIPEPYLCIRQNEDINFLRSATESKFIYLISNDDTSFEQLLLGDNDINISKTESDSTFILLLKDDKLYSCFRSSGEWFLYEKVHLIINGNYDFMKSNNKYVVNIEDSNTLTDYPCYVRINNKYLIVNNLDDYRLINKPIILKDVSSDITPISAIAFNDDNCQPCKIAKRDNKWYIDEPINFIPDFVKVQYIGNPDDYYYGNPDDYYYNVPSPVKERYNYFIWKDSLIAKYLPNSFISDIFHKPLSYGRLYLDGTKLHVDGFNIINGYPSWFNFKIIYRYFSGSSKDNMDRYPFTKYMINDYTIGETYNYGLYPPHQFHTLYLQLIAYIPSTDYDEGQIYPLYFDNLNDNSNLQILKIDIDFTKSGSDQISCELVDYTTLNNIFKD